LVEGIDFEAIKPHLQNLPLATVSITPKSKGGLLAGRPIPPMPSPPEKGKGKAKGVKKGSKKGSVPHNRRFAD